VGLRALADYAQAAALPDADRLLPRVAVESAWESDPGPRSLRAWLDLLPEAEQGPVRTTHRAARPLRFEDVYADLALRLDEAWAHFHGRRFVASREVLDALRREAPDFWPALKLEATVLEELELPNQAVALLERAGAREAPPWPEAAYRDALRAAGRTDALFVALQAEVESGEATADELYQWAAGLRARGDLVGALATLDRIGAARPELWGLPAGDRGHRAVRGPAARPREPAWRACSRWCRTSRTCWSARPACRSPPARSPPPSRRWIAAIAIDPGTPSCNATATRPAAPKSAR
jgi:tetratricopeptide (TPR) repeat protein